MKKITILPLAITFFMFSCSGPSSKDVKVDEVQINDSLQNLDIDNNDYKKDMEKYKEIAAKKFTENEKSIEYFKERIASQKKEAKAEYEKKIADLSDKNTDMKKKLSNFKTDTNTKWELFKNEFSHDLDELGKAFKDFTVKNQK